MQNYLVIDLEATCSNNGMVPRTEMEIIEIGAVLLSSSNLKAVDEFQSFVRPVRHPQLTKFCRELTGIKQRQVDAAPGFGAVLMAMCDWMDDHAPLVFCSWGNYDRTQLRADCDHHGVAYPFSDEHINLKAEFAQATGRKKMGLQGALRSVGLTFIGSHHRGIDDARNIASLTPYVLGPGAL